MFVIFFPLVTKYEKKVRLVKNQQNMKRQPEIFQINELKLFWMLRAELTQ